MAGPVDERTTLTEQPMQKLFSNLLTGIILIGIVASIIACGNGKYDWVSTLPHPWTLGEDEVNQLLPQFQDHYPDFQERLKAFALWRVGTPYEIFKLGEEQEPDPDPLIRLDVSDCTGHILTSLAFVQSRTWTEARERMVTIHYKKDSTGQKKATYTRRWHFTTDRILNNPYTVNITSDIIPESELKTLNITLNKTDSGDHTLPIEWEYPFQIKYIGNDHIDQSLLDRLPNVCGVAFVKSSLFDQGIVMGHEGMIIDHRYLIHASQSAGETEMISLFDYYFRKDGPLFDGIMVYEFRPIEQ